MTSPPATPTTTGGPTRVPAWLWQLVGWALLYSAMLYLGRLTRSPDTGLAVVWPAAGIGVVWARAAWLRGHSVAVDLGALAICAGLVNHATGAPWLTAGMLAVGNLFGSMAAGALAAGILGPRRVRLRQRLASLNTLGDLRMLLVVCLVAAAPLGLIGVIRLLVSEPGPHQVGAVVVVFCDFLARYTAGALVVLPVWMRLTQPIGRKDVATDLRRRDFWAFLAVGFGVAMLLASRPHTPLIVAVLPLLVWLSLGFSLTVTTVMHLVTSAAVVWSTLASTSGLEGYTAVQRSLLGQCVLLALGLVALTLSLFRDERAQALAEAHLAAESLSVQSARLEQSEQLYRAAFANAPIGTALVSWSGDQLGRIRVANPVMAQMFGVPADELIGTQFLDRVAALDRPQLNELALTQDQPQTLDIRITRPNGSLVHARTSLSLTPSPNDEPLFVAMVEDITAQREMQLALEHRALHDALTGLANRVLMGDRLRHALAAATREQHSVGVLYLDLDGFKQVNDAAGHAVGDELLCEVAQRLQALVRPGDTVARLGGDEFAIVCRDADDCGLSAVSERILAAIDEPCVIQGFTYRVGVSIGGASMPGCNVTEIGEDATDLLELADQAMYRAKRAGKHRLVLAGRLPAHD